MQLQLCHHCVHATHKSELLLCPDKQGLHCHVAGGSDGNAMMTPAPDAARFAGGGGGGADLDSLESRIWAHVKHVCSPSHKGRVSTLVKVCVYSPFHLFALMLATKHVVLVVCITCR